MSERVSGPWLKQWLGGPIASVRNRMDDWRTERRLGIRTTGTRPVPVHDAVAYSTFAYAGIKRVLDRLDLRGDDVFVDVGCGKGRVVCVAALGGVRRAVGIDLDGELCQVARANGENLLPRHAPIDIVHRAAQDYDYRDCTAMFMFNPFNRRPLDGVLKAVLNRPRPAAAIRLSYVHPRLDSAFAESGCFERYDHWPFRPASRLKFAVSFWRTV